MQFYPWQRFAAETWRMGEVPLWNPLVGNGAPLAANLQTGVFYPLNALHLLLPTEMAMSYTAALHVMIAGLFMFAFLRSLGLRPFSALLAAVAFQLSGFLIARLGFLSIAVTLPWVAAWLWRIERLIQSSRLRDVMWLALVVGLGLLAGHAQTALYGLFLLVVYVVFRSTTSIHHQDAKRLSEKLPPRRHPLKGTDDTKEYKEISEILGAFVPRGGFALSWWLIKWPFKTDSKTPRSFGVAVLLIAVGVLLGVGLASIQLLPAAELARESQRAGGLDYTFAMTHSYWPWRLLTLLTPDLFGNPAYGNFWGYDNYWENAAYIGWLPLMLAGTALREWWRLRRRMKDEGGGMRDEGERMKAEGGRLTRPAGEGGGDTSATPSSLQSPISNLQPYVPFFALIAAGSLVLAFGWFTDVYPFLFRAIPSFALFQGPARWLSVFTIAMCALSGIGAEYTLRDRDSLRRSTGWIVIGVALVGAGLASRGFLAGRSATFSDATARLGLFVAIGALLFGLRPPIGARSFSRWAIAVVAVVAFDLLTAHAALNPTLDPALYRLSSPSAEALRADGDGRVFLFDADDAAVRERFGVSLPFADFGPDGVEAWMDFRASQIANASMIDGIPSASNFDSLLVSQYLQLREAINDQPLDAALRLLGLMHVRYISSARNLALPVVYRSRVATIYRNDEALPRARIVPSARVEADPLAAVLDPSFDPQAEVILEQLPQSSDAELDTSRIAHDALRFTVQSLRDTPNTVTIRAASESDGWLVLADTWFPGWRASIDGLPAPVLRANVAFRAVALPAGEHVVEFRYEPDSFSAGMWIAAVSALIVVAGLIVSMRRR
jgi:hypothetical protein